ncbi:SDR family oxidoreductase [Thalassomonas viridans]|uniref:SDR family oxidoreductase n=1 Tax=Thalassomonas viridans TaxID=137584 RepID=A0AAE9Z6J8_9GAMM|nr:SDR family oxidoreductase [Thalassomonas viridans]WDE07691.1 SDR family oxidoreductase [Thalassomonas viridans]
MKLSDARVVITGATGGIAQSTVYLLAERGACLLLVGRNSDKLIALVKHLGSEHSWLSADISTARGRADVMLEAQRFGANMLVNNAGISEFNEFAQFSDARLTEAMNVNLLAPMCLTRSFLYELGDSAKVVLNVGSALGSIGYPYYSSYCATKFGLRGFTESLQRELTGSPHKVLYFAPRATDTSINSEAVKQMNRALGSKTDSPAAVAEALVKQLEQESKRVFIGWPEKLFTRLNGLWPEVVDNAISKKFTKIQKFVKMVNS